MPCGITYLLNERVLHKITSTTICFQSLTNIFETNENGNQQKTQVDPSSLSFLISQKKLPEYVLTFEDNRPHKSELNLFELRSDLFRETKWFHWMGEL